MSPNRSLFILAIIIAITQAAYIRRDEYTMASNCTESSRFKSAYYLVDACTPPSNVRYSFSGTVNVQYFGDTACSTGGSGSTPFTLGQCIHGTSTDYSHAYLESLPTLASGQTTYAIYDRSQSACSGSLQYLVQATPVCYLNADGSFKSATTVCSGTTQTLTKCTDTACSENCNAVTSELTNVCSPYDHDVNSCGLPATVSGSNNAGISGSNNAGTTGTNNAGTTGTNNGNNNNNNTATTNNNASTTSSIAPVGSGASSASSFLVSLAVLVVIGVLLL